VSTSTPPSRAPELRRPMRARARRCARTRDAVDALNAFAIRRSARSLARAARCRTAGASRTR
jgi:hypothetical protein